MGAGNHLCLGCSKDACQWISWPCVSGEGRIGWASEVGVYKSANVCIVDFMASRKGVELIFYF